MKLKKTQVEDHARIPSIYNKIKSVTACNDSLNSKTSNMNAVCATCGKCLVDSDHFAYAKYTLEILHKHGMEKGQSIGTPMATKPKLDADLSGNPVDQIDYCSKIESLMYLISSRPGIVQAGSSFDLTAFSDADHAGCIDTRQNTSEGIQFLGDKLVSWMSKKQNCTTMSSAEAERMALSASCAQSAIAISCNPIQPSRTKHIHTRYHFIKEQVENGIIEFYFVKTEYQLADMFTKALAEDRFKYLVRRIGMRCLTLAELELEIAILRYDGDECDKGRMLTKIELTLEQSQQGVSNNVLGSSFGLTAFSDVDHAGCIDTRKKAEYVALSASYAQVMWMRRQLQDYGLHYNKISLYCDSQSAIAISCNPVQHSRTKHIHTRYHFIKEQVENDIIELYFVRTEYQLADLFTKALPEDRFKYLVRRIGMRCLTPAELEVLAKESA
nr:hypothetical protein [Tanacetum cinerariifolium]